MASFRGNIVLFEIDVHEILEAGVGDSQGFTANSFQ
jgi:hypothetical protein